MTNTQPTVDEGGLYPIGQAAKALGINRTTLLRHTDAGNIRCKTRKTNDRKIYTGREIIRFWSSHY